MILLIIEPVLLKNEPENAKIGPISWESIRIEGASIQSKTVKNRAVLH